jgi:sarcosine oxidase subunit beta
MLSQRGIVTIAHNTHQLEMLTRWLNAMHLNGIDGELLSAAEVREWLPLLNDSPTARYPVKGGLVQRRGGVARHDAVAWSYARAADALGVDVIQNCEVIGFLREGDRVVGSRRLAARCARRKSRSQSPVTAACSPPRQVSGFP